MYHNDLIVDAVEDEPLSLFGSLEVAPDGSIAQEAIGSRMYQIDSALYNELDHHALMYDLKEIYGIEGTTATSIEGFYKLFRLLPVHHGSIHHSL